MNVIKHKKIFLSVAVILVTMSIASIAIFGLNAGIDFKGGTLWEVKITSSEQPTADNIRDFFANDLGKKNISVFPSDGSYLIRMEEISQEQHQQYLGALKERFEGFEELRFESIGPAIGAEVRERAIWAMVLVLLGISVFVAYAFRKVSYPIKSWKYGLVTLVTLFHDVVIPAGVFAFLGNRIGLEIDTNFIVALLVVIGFSVHDTIVVFDRIRENIITHRGSVSFEDLVNSSVNQTMARSINTSLTLVIVLLAMFLLGPDTLRYFVLTLLIGVVMGTYSSIFVASPLLTIWHKFSKV